jgi:hypothetical protein
MAHPRRLPPRLGNLTGGALEYLIHHVVLPPKLPQEDDSDASHEHALLDTTIRALRKFRDALQTVSPEAAQKIISVISTIGMLCQLYRDICRPTNLGMIIRQSIPQS